MRKHKDALSNSTLKRGSSNKYNKVERTVAPEDINKLYDKYQNGWRRKQCLS